MKSSKGFRFVPSLSGEAPKANDLVDLHQALAAVNGKRLLLHLEQGKDRLRMILVRFAGDAPHSATGLLSP